MAITRGFFPLAPGPIILGLVASGRAVIWNMGPALLLMKSVGLVKLAFTNSPGRTSVQGELGGAWLPQCFVPCCPPWPIWGHHSRSWHGNTLLRIQSENGNRLLELFLASSVSSTLSWQYATVAASGYFERWVEAARGTDIKRWTFWSAEYCRGNVGKIRRTQFEAMSSRILVSLIYH